MSPMAIRRNYEAAMALMFSDDRTRIVVVEEPAARPAVA